MIFSGRWRYLVLASDSISCDCEQRRTLSVQGFKYEPIWELLAKTHHRETLLMRLRGQNLTLSGSWSPRSQNGAQDVSKGCILERFSGLVLWSAAFWEIPACMPYRLAPQQSSDDCAAAIWGSGVWEDNTATRGLWGLGPLGIRIMDSQ